MRVDDAAQRAQLFKIVICALDDAVQLGSTVLEAEFDTEHEKAASAESLSLPVELIAGLEMIDDPAHPRCVIGKACVVVRVARGHVVEQPGTDLLGLMEHGSEAAGDDHSPDVLRQH